MKRLRTRLSELERQVGDLRSQADDALRYRIILSIQQLRDLGGIPERERTRYLALEQRLVNRALSLASVGWGVTWHLPFGEGLTIYSPEEHEWLVDFATQYLTATDLKPAAGHYLLGETIREFQRRQLYPAWYSLLTADDRALLDRLDGYSGFDAIEAAGLWPDQHCLEIALNQFWDRQGVGFGWAS